MEYLEQYKSPKWQKKRLEILERDNYTCTECGNDEKTLHVHHNYYTKIKKVWEYANDHMQTLCEDCHKERHELKYEIREFIDVRFVFNPRLQILHEILFRLSQMDISEMAKLNTRLYKKQNK